MLHSVCLLLPLVANSAAPVAGPRAAAPAPLAPAAALQGAGYGSTGADLDLTVAPGETRVIDLRTQGTFDADNWLVKFNYASVSIGAGATVRFLNHPSHAPVVWLVQGDVTIAQNAVVDLSGEAGRTGLGASQGHAEPGPGGFRGGRPAPFGTHSSSAGFGPGGSRGDATDNDQQYRGGGASFRVLGTNGMHASNPIAHVGSIYGSASLYQLIGGSGGGAAIYPLDNWVLGGGGAGGGAILIAADGAISVQGRISANGGSTTNCGGILPGGPGSGGSIRLASKAAITVHASGSLQVLQGSPGTCLDWGGYASDGRVRIESPGNSAALLGDVPASVSRGDSNFPAIRTQPPRVWVATIGGVASPDWRNVTAGLGEDGPADQVVAQTGAVDIVVDSSNLPLNSLVYLRVGRASGVAVELGPLTMTSGTSVVFTNVNLSAGYSALQARAVLPQQ